MEFGNVYEVFELGDLVKINNVRNIHCGRTGTIIGICLTRICPLFPILLL